MNLYLLRHGEAARHAPTDSARPLTAHGSRDVEAMGLTFSRRNLPVDCCFASPYLRAQQSAQLFLAGLKQQLPIRTETGLTPECPALQVIAFLERQQQENILLVSHNPLLSELRALLLNGHTQAVPVIGTGEMVAISLEIVGIGMGRESFHLLPQHFGAKA